VAWIPWLVAGLLLAALAWSQRRRPGAVAWAAIATWLACALLGAVMLYLWLGTAHRFAWANHNLILFNPLCLLLLPGAWRIARGRDGGAVFRTLLAVIGVLVLLSPFLLWMPLQSQRNGHWIALMLPLQLALAAVLWRPRRTGA
jgi:hypothetical protein